MQNEQLFNDTKVCHRATVVVYLKQKKTQEQPSMLHILIWLKRKITTNIKKCVFFELCCSLRGKASWRSSLVGAGWVYVLCASGVGMGVGMMHVCFHSWLREDIFPAQCVQWRLVSWPATPTHTALSIPPPARGWSGWVVPDQIDNTSAPCRPFHRQTTNYSDVLYTRWRPQTLTHCAMLWISLVHVKRVFIIRLNSF